MDFALLQLSITLSLIVVVSCISGSHTGRTTNKSHEKHRNRQNKIFQDKDLEEAITFTAKADAILLQVGHNMSMAEFEYSANVTEANAEKEKEVEIEADEFLTKIYEEAGQFDWKSFKGRNETLYRWFELLFKDEFVVDESVQKYKYSRTKDKKKTMDEIFNAARMCPYRTRGKYKSCRSDSACNLKCDPEVDEIMGHSRDPEELKYYWEHYRNVTGKKIREKFIEDLEMKDEIAEEANVSDFSKFWISSYESISFLQDMDKIQLEFQKIYHQLHAYVRTKLSQFYKKVYIAESGPIPAHLLANIHAQRWSDIFDILNPYPNLTMPNVTQILMQKGMEPIDIFIMGEEFFMSMGLDPMTPHFWKYSMTEEPKDRKVICHATATNMFNGKDYRIKMCTTVTETSLSTVFHEMGHIHYYMQYKNLSFVFQSSANPGFHEAAGDFVVLSISNLKYLEGIGFLNKSSVKDVKTEIILLLKLSLHFFPSIPYAYIVDSYRYGLFNKTIKTKHMNQMWWKYRFLYQGVCPPVTRTEEDFDAGSKHHVANNIEYMRYYFASILTFQLHKYLCREAGHKGPLHQCTVYGNEKAGNLLKKLFSLGRSKPWQEVIKMLSNGETSQLHVEPLLEYFQPLHDWLKKENKGKTIGWKTTNLMKCPSKEDKKGQSNSKSIKSLLFKERKGKSRKLSQNVKFSYVHKIDNFDATQTIRLLV